MPNISVKHHSRITFSPDSRERYLHAGERNFFEKAGIEMSGMSELTAGYTVDRAGYPVHVLLVTLRGRAHLHTPRGELHLDPGRMALLPAGASYDYRAGKRWTVLWFHFHPDTIWDNFFLTEAEVYSGSMHMELRELAERFLAENLRRDRSDAPAILDSLARLIVLYLQRELTAIRNEPQPEERRQLETLWQDVESALGSPWTIATLSHRIGWSRSKLQALCSRFYGQGAMERVTRLRMEHASQRMRSSTVKLAQIAETVGYGDVFAFSKAFKRVLGMAPSAHRAKSGEAA